MNKTGSERPKPWNGYTTSTDPSPSQAGGIDRQVQWQSYGTSSMSAISYGFVATAILVSMFLIMAIFEHLFRPSPNPFSTPQSLPRASLESAHFDKHGRINRQTVSFDIVCAGFLSSDAGRAVSDLHCATGSSPDVLQGRGALAFP
ncbi:hypothetical protein DVH24_033136 [Malus domestica]|uniref:Uncharacterized protein n=1 Tax=Malus domestica TaxID=3750 RepID=A0A498J9T3_MALDO|nr:hypothetical protein DVH24_033136 [Malus domestica]